MTNTYFTKEEIMTIAKELIEEGFQGDANDLTMEIGNKDYYIIGTAQSEEALEEYGLFNAIKKVKQFERENYGEVDTDISNPEELATALFLAVTSEVIAENFEQLKSA